MFKCLLSEVQYEVTVPCIADRAVMTAAAVVLTPIFGAPGEAWCFQRVKNPAPERGRATPPGIEPWTHGGNDMG
jgi:hypothetical protein